MTTSTKRFPIAVLVVAIVALIGSIAWVASRSDGNRLGYDRAMMGIETKGGEVRDIADARTRFDEVARGDGLRVGEVMQFSRNYYGELLDKQGAKATELLLDPATGRVTTEYGAAMLWNTRYGIISGSGMMGGSGTMGGAGGGSGMMGGSLPDPGSASGPVSADQAQTVAQRWLDANMAGTRVASPDEFPGYYTLHIARDGKTVGMLSVNSSTGAVWYHWWHGDYVGMIE